MKISLLTAYVKLGAMEGMDDKQDIFSLADCLIDFEDSPACSKPLADVYSDAVLFCQDARLLLEDSHLAYLSNLLMQFVCLNTLFNPLIYAFCYPQLRRSLSRAIR